VSLEEDARLDPAVDRLRGITAPFDKGAVGDALRGTWLGHALHPFLTDLPLGLWTAASVLDLVGGPLARPAAQRLVGLGLTAVPATAASGWAEWHQADRPAQRVGVAHVALNVAGIGLYAGSWLARRGDRHRVGVVLGLLGAGMGGAAAAAIAGQHARISELAARVGHAPPEEQREALHDLLRLLAAHEAVEEELIHPVVPTLGDREVGVARVLEENGMAQQISILEGLDVNASSFAVQLQLFQSALTYHSHAEEEEELPHVVSRLGEKESAFIVGALADLESWATTSSGSFAEMLETARARVRALAPA
jgi:hemerythrin superfamily protein